MVNRHSKPQQSVGTMTQNAPKGTPFVHFMMASLAVAISQHLLFEHLLPFAGLSVESNHAAVIERLP